MNIIYFKYSPSFFFKNVSQILKLMTGIFSLLWYNPIKYEKDNTDINQINFISYSSNLRASNYYYIENYDKIIIKIVAGKIIPALITSTSSVAGLLAVQIYILSQNSNCKTFRTDIIDLSDNTLSLCIPQLI